MVSKFLSKLARDRKGQGLVEYGILVAGIALVALVSVSVLGHKTSDMVGTVAAILPGTEQSDFGAIASGKLIETTTDPVTNAITLDSSAATTATDVDRLDTNAGISNSGSSALVLDPTP